MRSWPKNFVVGQHQSTPYSGAKTSTVIYTSTSASDGGRSKRLQAEIGLHQAESIAGR
jgi:hypothetical protein